MQLVQIAVKKATSGNYAIQIQQEVYQMMGGRLSPVEFEMPDTPALYEDEVPEYIRGAVSDFLNAYFD